VGTFFHAQSLITIEYQIVKTLGDLFDGRWSRID
jgi:hypothetical protein